MAKSKTIKIDDREITVKELKVKVVRLWFEMSETKEDNIMTIINQFLPLVTNLKIEDVEDMAPSELKLIWEAFKEVNADFLEWVEHLGITKMLGSLIQKQLNEAFAGLSSGDTLTPGITDGVSS